MRSVHVPEHVVLKLSMEDRDELLLIVSRIKNKTPFIQSLQAALFIGQDVALAENKVLPQ